MKTFIVTLKRHAPFAAGKGHGTRMTIKVQVENAAAARRFFSAGGALITTKVVQS